MPIDMMLRAKPRGRAQPLTHCDPAELSQPQAAEALYGLEPLHFLSLIVSQHQPRTANLETSTICFNTIYLSGDFAISSYFDQNITFIKISEPSLQVS